jgi:hypothetical protein
MIRAEVQKQAAETLVSVKQADVERWRKIAEEQA